MEKQIKFLEECMDMYTAYSQITNVNKLMTNDESPNIKTERIDSLINENKKLKQSCLIKDEMINNFKHDIKDMKKDLLEKIKAIEKLNIELESVKKERNDNILQLHELLKSEKYYSPSHIIKESFSSINTYSTNSNVINEKTLIDKISNERLVLEGMLFECKIKYADAQTELGKYKDQIISLRKKLQEANDKLNKKDEIIQKFVLSKEKIPLNDINQLIPNASRLDLTLALTENSNNTLSSPYFKTNPTNSKLSLTPREKESSNNNVLTHNSELSVGQIHNLKVNYNTLNNNIRHLTTPEKNTIVNGVKEQKENGSIFKKIKSLFSSEKKQK